MGSKDTSTRGLAGLLRLCTRLRPPPVEFPRVQGFLAGNLPDDEGNYPPHTPWMMWGPDGSGPWIIRCGGQTPDTAHESFDSLVEWAEHIRDESPRADLADSDCKAG